MDWARTKTIFIIVFSILNIFLFSVYLNQQDQAQNVEVITKLSVVETLKLDNITYGEIPEGDFDSSYISADIVKFSDEMFEGLVPQATTIIDQTIVRSVLDQPIPIFDEKEGEMSLDRFLKEAVYMGEQFGIWSVDIEDEFVLLFQEVVDESIYFNPSAHLKIYFNENGEAYKYEQRMLEGFLSYNKKKDLISPFEAISTLLTHNQLKPNSSIESVALGYSTLVQVTENQVLAPTWHIRVLTEEGEIEDHFVNAVERKMIQFQIDFKEFGF